MQLTYWVLFKHWSGREYQEIAVLNRLLKFPRAKKAPGKGYILGRRGRETDSIETHESDDELDGIYIDRRPAPHQTLYDPDSHSIVVESSSSDESNHDDDHNAARSSTSGESKHSFTHKINIAPAAASAPPPPQTPSSPKRTMNSSSSFTNIPKMATRYRFRDLLLGDFSFNDDGERWVETIFQFSIFI